MLAEEHNTYDGGSNHFYGSDDGYFARFLHLQNTLVVQQVCQRSRNQGQ